jgi:hypothetical protein
LAASWKNWGLDAKKYFAGPIIIHRILTGKIKACNFVEEK